jgi:hypothetical protein
LIFSHLTSQRSEQQYFSLPFKRRRIIVFFCRFSPQHAQFTCSMNPPPDLQIIGIARHSSKATGIRNSSRRIFLCPEFRHRMTKG